MIVFLQKYPRWWFDWNLELLRFSNRAGAYLGGCSTHPNRVQAPGTICRMAVMWRDCRLW
jgi:hypothetical protein